jgi:glycosyltransferase involved in cell wall biosynthesis
MKIGIYSPYLDTLTGGEKYIFTAASCLSSEHNVSIFWDNPFILKNAAEKFNINLDKVRVVDNVFSKNSSFIKRFIATLKYDRIFYLSDGSLPIVGSKKLLIHFQFPVEWVNTNSFLFLFKKHRITKVLCNSYFTKKFIDKKFDINSYVLYPPASTNKNIPTDKENIILTVGRFSTLPSGGDFKKLDVLTHVFKEFQKKRLKGWKLVVVTSVAPGQKQEFEQFEKKNKSNFITIYSNVEYSQIIKLYKQAKIYWHASGYLEDLQKHPERAEHFGISTVEAMSFGVVPVVIDAGGQPEIVKDFDNGFLWTSEKELIEKTHKLAVDKSLYAEMSKKAFESSQNFTVVRFCEELNHLIW